MEAIGIEVRRIDWLGKHIVQVALTNYLEKLSIMPSRLLGNKI